MDDNKLDREVAKAKGNALIKANALPKKRRGRPPKKAIDANTAGKARLLASPKSNKVVEAIFDAALDDNHKGQQAAWKLLMDRMMPVSMFEKEIDPNGGSARPVINISIGTVGGSIDMTQSNEDDDYIDGDVDND